MKRARILMALVMCIGMALMLAPLAQADNFSFTGNFTQDDNVQLFNFTVGASSNVILRSWSYAGGVNAAGQSIPEGGFDPILAFFDNSGLLIGQNDDGGCALVPADSVTGECYDVYLAVNDLPAGKYTVSVMEYDNFANGPNLSDGFLEQGNGNFTTEFANSSTAPGCSKFIDVTGDCRDGRWAFDILGADQASTPPPTITPEPAAVVLFGTGMLILAGVWTLKKRRGAAKLPLRRFI